MQAEMSCSLCAALEAKEKGADPFAVKPTTHSSKPEDPGKSIVMFCGVKSDALLAAHGSTPDYLVCRLGGIRPCF